MNKGILMLGLLAECKPECCIEVAREESNLRYKVIHYIAGQEHNPEAVHYILDLIPNNAPPTMNDLIVSLKYEHKNWWFEDDND